MQVRENIFNLATKSSSTALLICFLLRSSESIFFFCSHSELKAIPGGGAAVPELMQPAISRVVGQVHIIAVGDGVMPRPFHLQEPLSAYEYTLTQHSPPRDV